MSTHPPRILIRDLTIRYGAFTALERLDVDVPGGEIVGLVGPNGAGKTTLLNAISGLTDVSSGTVTLGEHDLTGLDVRRRVQLGLLRGFQTVRLLERETVLTNVMVGTERLAHPFALSQLFALPQQWRAQRRDLDAAGRVLRLLGLFKDRYRLVSELPFASRRLVEVARVLISDPSVILLDEPAAGLDQEGRRELAEVLHQVHREHPSTMVIVEHDVDLVKTLCWHVIALDSGSYLCHGTPAEVFADERVQLAYFGRVNRAGA
jgi:branched-chain amino acid transport system ATP-binding protein